MYQDLVQRLPDGYHDTYTRIIKEHNHFSVEQKDCLTPENRSIIDKRKLGFTIYVQIYSLLGGFSKWTLMRYMIDTRNLSCHYLLQRILIGKDFNNEWLIMRQHFELYNFKKGIIRLVG